VCLRKFGTVDELLTPRSTHQTLAHGLSFLAHSSGRAAICARLVVVEIECPAKGARVRLARGAKGGLSGFSALSSVYAKSSRDVSNQPVTPQWVGCVVGGEPRRPDTGISIANEAPAPHPSTTATRSLICRSQPGTVQDIYARRS